MSKIKIITDFASDINLETAKKLDIKVIGFPITLDGKAFREGVDFTTDEFYNLLDNAKEFPSTSQITFLEFVDAYKEVYDQGYSDLIYVSISSTGSNTHNNAHMAVDKFFEEYPEAEGKMKIHIVDSLNYSGAYGYPIAQAALKIKKNLDLDEILSYLEDWFKKVEIYFASYTLKYLKRSGRVSAVAAFAGEVLGLKPIISMAQGKSTVMEKIRGEKNIIPKIIETAKRNMIPHSPYCVLAGSLESETQEMIKEITAKLGYPPEEVYKVGATISCHAGHQIVGIIIKSM